MGKALAWGWAAAMLAWVSSLSPAHPDKQLGAKRAPRQISLASLGWQGYQGKSVRCSWPRLVEVSLWGFSLTWQLNSHIWPVSPDGCLQFTGAQASPRHCH